MDISQIDRNFEVKSAIQKADIVFHPASEAPMQIYGVVWENGHYRRMPEAVAKSVSEGVYTLHTHTAGGRLRFRTDSTYVAISACMDQIGKMPHFALTGSAGFDLYEAEDGEEQYRGSFIPPFDLANGYEAVIELGQRKMRELTVNFPLYSSVCSLHIGLQQDAVLEAATPYLSQAPIVYYGSSITQGGCASRPGISYQAIICRRLHRDYRNLGFSGAAMGEDTMTEYLSSIPMSAFVMDYDHNAPDVAHLRATHEKMFQKIRRSHPGIPIILMSRPKHFLTSEETERLEVIRNTYRNAVNAGDHNVYLLTGSDLTELCGSDGTVDNTHPTDLGFASIAHALGDLLEQIG